MISDEVQMLINRMKSNPEEFNASQLEFGDTYEVRDFGKWNQLINSLVNQKPGLEIIFTPEEIKALKETLYEILRPAALGAIVKTIVGGASTPEEMYQQMEMEYSHPSTASRTEKLQEARVQLIKQYLESQSRGEV